MKYVMMFITRPDLDTAIAMAKEWPSLQFPGVAVEIRPIVDHSGG